MAITSAVLLSTPYKTPSSFYTHHLSCRPSACLFLTPYFLLPTHCRSCEYYRRMHDGPVGAARGPTLHEGERGVPARTYGGSHGV